MGPSPNLGTMAEINIESGTGDSFTVTVHSRTTTTHRVTLEDSDFGRLSPTGGTKEDLIRRSFEFLLRREPNTSILSSFDLPVIGRYFPEYEREMKKGSNAKC